MICEWDSYILYYTITLYYDKILGIKLTTK